jgi:HK97 family phage portal protein
MILDRLFKRSLEGPYELTHQRIMDVFAGAPVHAGVNVSQQSALGVTAVYRAVAIIAGSVAALPLRAFRDRPDGRDDLGAPWFETEPYPDVSPFQFKELLMGDLLLWGNHYSLKIRSETGDRILRLLRIPPDMVTVRRERPTGLNPSGKLYKAAGVETPYTPWEMLHVPGLGYDGLVGLSPISLARQAIGLAIAAEEYGARLFGSGALMSGILTTDQALPDEATAQTLKDRWRDKIAGVAKSHEIVVLDRGAKFEPVGINPEDAQMLATRQFSIQEIARLYGVPPFLLADSSGSTSWGSGLQTFGEMFVRFTLASWLTRVEERLSHHLLPRGQRARFVTDALLRGSATERAAYYQTMHAIGALTVEEIRDREDLSPQETEETEETSEPAGDTSGAEPEPETENAGSPAP